MPHFYDCIPRLMDALSDPNHRALGELGEFYARKQFEKAGYVVSNTHRDKRGDLIVIDPGTGEFVRVEVKTARKGKVGWKFLLYKKGHTDYRDSDYIMLQAVLKSGDVVLFLIPRADLGERSQIAIKKHPSDYTGMWARYRTSILRISEVAHD